MGIRRPIMSCDFFLLNNYIHIIMHIILCSLIPPRYQSRDTTRIQYYNCGITSDFKYLPMLLF